jgi:CheY-like chemotaxis protein
MDKKIIMLVEDDELDVISVRRSLAKLDIPYELYTAFNGVEALELLRGGPATPAPASPATPTPGSTSPTPASPATGVLPDILLLDLNMPRMNGLEFLAAIRADPRLKNIPVFIMTTSGDQVDRSATQRLGVSGYLIKPMSYGSGYNRTDSMEHFVQFHLRNILLRREDPAP